ncbi:MAG: TolC family protein [Bacteroidia bacterium]|nr:TolC family protein [Bacteroidia bacterium]
MKNWILIVLFMTLSLGFSQEKESEFLRFEEFMGMVKSYHPLVKQANLIIEQGQANLLKARGGFDPKLEVDFDRKSFKNSTYYDKLNATFKIPTWYGVEFQANFEETDGSFLNPEASLPENGLYNAGVSVSLAQGFLINERMAALKQAKLFKKQTQAERDLMVNELMYKAALSYFEWLQASNAVLVYQNFLQNTEFRFNAVVKSIEAGETAAIDSVEASIAFNNRRLSLEKARLDLTKARLFASNFLWLENNIPVELKEEVLPLIDRQEVVEEVLEIDEFSNSDFVVSQHPKIQALNLKSQSLEVDRRLKANMLLPQVDLKYNFLSETPRDFSSFNTANYKSALRLAFPLFLRKERGALRLTKLKLQDIEFEIYSTEVQIQNKLVALENAAQSYTRQLEINDRLVRDYERLLRAEERKFGLGESSLFLVNSRETKLIEARLKAIGLLNDYYFTQAEIFNGMARNPIFE